MQADAQVPGFRPGRAPRRLVEKRFRKQVAEQVKSALLMAALEQIRRGLQAQPDHPAQARRRGDRAARRRPDDVRDGRRGSARVRGCRVQGLKVKRPVKAITRADVDARFRRFLERYAQLVPKLEGAAEHRRLSHGRPDVPTRRQRAQRGQGNPVPAPARTAVPGRSRYPDGSALLWRASSRARAREAEAKIGSGRRPTRALRGKTISVKIAVHDLKQLRLPEVESRRSSKSIGFDSLEELREAAPRDPRAAELSRSSGRRSAARSSSQLIAATPFELPADLVARQEKIDDRGSSWSCEQEGFSDSDIRAREAEIRANAHEIDPPQPQGVLHPGEDRRGGGDQGRG